MEINTNCHPLHFRVLGLGKTGQNVEYSESTSTRSWAVVDHSLNRQGAISWSNRWWDSSKSTVAATRATGHGVYTYTNCQASLPGDLLGAVTSIGACSDRPALLQIPFHHYLWRHRRFTVRLVNYSKGKQ